VIAAALKVVDASILVGNSRVQAEAFTVGRVQVGPMPLFDISRGGGPPLAIIAVWLDVMAPD
jgi:hypothetical protein